MKRTIILFALVLLLSKVIFSQVLGEGYERRGVLSNSIGPILYQEKYINHPKLDKINDYSSVKQAVYSSKTFSKAENNIFSKLKNLETLILIECQGLDKKVLKNFPKLKEIQISAKYSEPYDLLNTLPSPEYVEKLSIHQHFYDGDDRHLQSIKTLQKFNNLKEFKINNAQHQEKIVEIVSNMKDLESLDFYFMHDNYHLLKSFSKLKRLKKLKLKTVYADKNIFQVINKNFKHIKKISLSVSRDLNIEENFTFPQLNNLIELSIKSYSKKINLDFLLSTPNLKRLSLPHSSADQNCDIILKLKQLDTLFIYYINDNVNSTLNILSPLLKSKSIKKIFIPYGTYNKEIASAFSKKGIEVIPYKEIR